MRDLGMLLAYVGSRPWAIEERRGAAIAQVLARRAAGVRLSAAQVEEIVGADRDAKAARVAAAADSNAQRKGVAVVSIIGTLVARETDIDASHGGFVSVESVLASFRAAQHEPSVQTIILDIDSPGGDVAGIPEAGAEIAASPKQVVAVANTWMCSAAYWLASQASEIDASPSAEVGSVGVLCLHLDYSKQLEIDGVKPTLVRYGENKAATSPYFPLSETAQADLQKRADEVGREFDQAVARGRGVGPKAVREKFGQGRVFGAEESVAIGMADRVATLEETISRFLGGGRVSGPRQRAAAPAQAGISAARRRRDLEAMRG